MHSIATLFVTGFAPNTKAKTLAYEFERFGPLVRLDIPAPKTRASKPYAFVEYESEKDAKDAFREMNGVIYKGYRLNVTWAKTELYHQRQPSLTKRDRSPIYGRSFDTADAGRQSKSRKLDSSKQVKQDMDASATR